jgi:hypothetical protein
MRSEPAYPVFDGPVLRSLLIIMLAFGLSAPVAQAARPLDVGFYDGMFSSGGGDDDGWFQRAAAVGTQLLRVEIGWPTSRRPAEPRDPADPAYDFSRADAAVRAITANGFEVDLSFTGAPAWAEGPNRPADVRPGSWMPDVEALGAYGAALAQRYSGSFPDPLHPGSALPRVEYFQVWNEPNLTSYLAPQWVRRQGQWEPFASTHYRSMLNAFADGVASVRSDAQVITAGTAPFGDPVGGNRTRPLRFWRDLLQKPTRFNVAAHHPYSVGAPSRSALHPDDMSIPDVGSLRRLLDRRQYSQPLWVTEVSYDSSPPDPDGVPIARHARWLSQTMYLLWKARVSTVLWFLLRDQAPDPSYDSTLQSGVYFIDGTAKPAATAFRFPFVVTPGAGRVGLWARAPASGMLIVEEQRAESWVPRARREVQAGDVVRFTLKARNGVRFRARVGDVLSLPVAGRQFAKVTAR